jgi:hypothetical protein
MVFPRLTPKPGPATPPEADPRQTSDRLLVRPGAYTCGTFFNVWVPLVLILDVVVPPYVTLFVEVLVLFTALGDVKVRLLFTPASAPDWEAD